jgi:hypothetical protein
MKRIFFAFSFLAMSLVACEKNANESKSEANNTNNVNGVGTSEKSETTNQTNDAPKAAIKFDSETYNFGSINEGEKVRYAYKFKNEGKNPLIIQSANASCGCTVPTYPKDPIPPGGTGEIIAEYNGSGSGDITKTITITANTEPTTTTLYIKGFVKSKNPQAEDASKMKGPLRNQ